MFQSHCHCAPSVMLSRAACRVFPFEADHTHLIHNLTGEWCTCYKSHLHKIFKKLWEIWSCKHFRLKLRDWIHLRRTTGSGQQTMEG